MVSKILLPLLACLVTSNLALESDWNQEMRDYITDIHNDYRRNEGGCQMNQLEYDTTLEEHAKYWAERCVFEHEYGDYGENLAWNSNHIPEQDLIQDAAQSWFDEKYIYSYGQYSCGSSCHYTAMVWDITEKIGCYTTRCPDLRYAYKDSWYLVCFYTPKGNWMGEKPYEKTCDAPCPEDRTLQDGLCVAGGGGSTGGSSEGNGGGESGGDAGAGTVDTGNGGSTESETIPCVDANSNCEFWAQHGYCNSNPSYMHKNCMASCAKCTGGEDLAEGGGTKAEPCVDNNSNCEFWADHGYCETSPSYMHENCMASCTICTPSNEEVTPCTNDHTSCEMWAENQQCSLNPDYMHKNCRKACKLC